MTSAINIDDIHVDDSADDNIVYVDHVDVNDETMTMTMTVTTITTITTTTMDIATLSTVQLRR